VNLTELSIRENSFNKSTIALKYLTGKIPIAKYQQEATGLWQFFMIF
jgi:hypothetical protein